MIVGFIIFWPIGLGILAYLIWSGKMHDWKGQTCRHWRGRHRNRHGRQTGNTAFDAYRDQTLKRLEEEQQAFEEFLDRLRRAKDQQEFDQFMTERSAQQPSA